MRLRIVPGLALLLVLAVPARAQVGGGFDLSWHAVAGGGRTAVQGGAFQLGGTAGQSDAARASGGAYSLTGGFWNGATLAFAGIADGIPPVPTAFALLPAHPNPLTTRALLEFDLAGPARTRLEIYDVAGHRVRSLVDATLAPGRQRVAWDGRDALGGVVPTGIYFARLTAGSFSASARLVVLH
jgi:hypothetical protein